MEVRGGDNEGGGAGGRGVVGGGWLEGGGGLVLCTACSIAGAPVMSRGGARSGHRPNSYYLPKLEYYR
jgi:hypothetical protein